MSKASKFLNYSVNQTADEPIRVARARTGLVAALGCFQWRRGDRVVVKRGAQERRGGIARPPGVRGRPCPGRGALEDLNPGRAARVPARRRRGRWSGRRGRGEPGGARPSLAARRGPAPAPRYKGAGAGRPPATLRSPPAPLAARAHHGLHSAARRKMALSGEQRLRRVHEGAGRGDGPAEDGRHSQTRLYHHF